MSNVDKDTGTVACEPRWTRTDCWAFLGQPLPLAGWSQHTVRRGGETSNCPRALRFQCEDLDKHRDTCQPEVKSPRAEAGHPEPLRGPSAPLMVPALLR